MPQKAPTHAQRSRTTKRPKDSRQSAAKRGYDRTWRKFRTMFLRKYPLCSDIHGVHKAKNEVAAATEVDHIKPIDERPDLRLVESNCRSLCKPCHSRRTAHYRKEKDR